MKENILVVHGGAPTAVMNASLYGVIREAEKYPNIDHIYAAIGGSGGILKEHFLDFKTIEKDKIESLPYTPASAIGTSRDALEKEDYEHTVYDMMAEEADLDECLVKNIQDNLDVLPSDMNLAGAEIEFQEVEDKETLLKRYLDKVRDNYDFILIDCPPSLNILTINALTAADTVLVPIQCEYYALEGLNQVLKTVELVKRKLNPQLELEGVVFTMYDARTNLSLQVVESVKNNLNQTIYKTIIPRNVRLAEAPSHGMPINLYDTRSTGAESYRMLAAEVMSRGEEL